MSHPRGSLWRRWDLHVHTPASLHHNYRGSGDNWERFISELEQLPPEFSVIGLNDYLFLDGYRRVMEWKAKGRLGNIETFLPVLEFRLLQFAGTEDRLRRINLHVIFSDDLSAEHIQQQFLDQLRAHYQLAPGDNNKWGGVLTRDSLRDFGQQIIDSTPPEKRNPGESPLWKGFCNLNLPLDSIKQALDSPYLRNQYLTAVGNTEWNAMRWNDQVIAQKKDIINQADISFVAAPNAAAYTKARDALRDQGVRANLLDCSDAHHWSDSGEKDSIGRCELWLKSDPTFRGLQHALLEFDQRVYVGSEPPKVANVRKRPSRYLDSVEIRKADDSSLTETWFDCEQTLNPGLVAIIGNKGNGKSALADILALGANSLRDEKSFSFLNKHKFRNPRVNKSEHFAATLRWASSDEHSYRLSDSPDTEGVERVRYIPQSHLEDLCNEFAAEGGGAFDDELRAVIFSHIPVGQRLGKQRLDSLLDYLSEETYDKISSLQADLAKTNRALADLEAGAAPEYEREVRKKHTARLKELDTLKKGEPKAVPKPDADPATKQAVEGLQSKIEAARKKEAEFSSQVVAKQSAREELLSKIAIAEKLLQRIRNFEDTHQSVARESAEELESLDLTWEKLVQLRVETAPLKALHEEWTKEEASIRSALDPEQDKSLTAQLASTKAEAAALQSQLDAPTRKYQEYLGAHKEWQANIEHFEKGKGNPDSIESLKKELQWIAALPQQIADLEAERMEKCLAIYEQIAGLKAKYRELYKPVQDFITQHKTLAKSIQLSFDVRISERNLVEGISDWINKQRSGSFQGADDGNARIKELVDEHSFDSPEGVEAFLRDFMDLLKQDVRHTPPRAMSPASQLKKDRTVHGFYDFLFGLRYLEPRYALKMEEKELFELSPGERGLLLLLFYLLVEKSEDPLILDQPEENLDNETVHNVLVPSIKLAKQMRQIIIVTHNPNLAVVADADQVISASIDKSDRCRVTYTSGSLENPTVIDCVVRYLEGTLPAFMKRRDRYPDAP